MTTDNDAPVTDLEDEKLIVQIKGAYLEGAGRGKLSLTSRRIEFEHRKGLLSPPQVDLSVDLSHIFSAKARSESSTLTIEWLDDSGASVVSELTLPQGNTTERLHRILTSRLRRLKQEADLREHVALYQSYLWTTAYHAWLTAQFLGRVVKGLIGQDWDAVETASANARDSATSLPGCDASGIDRALQALAETIISRDAPLVLGDVTAAYRAVGASLSSQVPPDDRWIDVSAASSSGLAWPHIRYVFLFSAWQALASTWRQSGDMAQLDALAPGVTPLLTILADAISPELQPGAAGTAIDPSSLESAARNLEALLRINAGIS